MKTILVPTDFSKCAANALRYAFEVAQRTGATIEVLHVVFPNEGVENNVYSAFWIDEYVKQREKDLKSWVRRHSARNAELKKVHFNVQCSIGFPASSVEEVGDRERASLIVMGTTGATGLRGVLLGSVAAGVIARTKIPVLVVPEKADYKERARAVFATDFRLKLSEKSMEALRALPSLQEGKLHVVHIQDKPGPPDKSLESSFSQKLGGLRHDFHYLHDRDVIQAVMNFMESTDAEMLVAVAHEHSLLHRLFNESVTRRLAQRVKVPMLVLHDAK